MIKEKKGLAKILANVDEAIHAHLYRMNHV